MCFDFHAENLHKCTCHAFSSEFASLNETLHEKADEVSSGSIRFVPLMEFVHICIAFNSPGAIYTLQEFDNRNEKTGFDLDVAAPTKQTAGELSLAHLE